MKVRTPTLLLAILVAGLALPAPAQEGEQGMDLEQYMKEYMEKYATPAEHQEHLALLAGKWTTKNIFWPAPGAPPMESTGTGEHKMVLGGRYLLTSYKGEFMGQPFEGMGSAGYDRFLEKYVETWIDSMGTMTLVSEGHCENDGTVRTMTADFVDPMTGQESWMRSVYRVVDADHYVLEMYNPSPTGEEFKMMEIVHTRVK